MSDASVVCPKCGAEFKLTESLAAPLIEEERRRAREEIASREAAADKKLADAAEMLANARKQERALKDKEIELNAEIERRVAQETESIRAEAGRSANEAWSLRLDEKEKLIADMQKTISELKEKASLTSQQLQGEVLELKIEELLRERFVFDDIEPVPKGVRGADVIQRVCTSTGGSAGTIVWEMKRAKDWKADWLEKLRADARAVKADVSVLVSSVMPKGVESFALVDDVWVCAPRYAEPVAAMLRQSLINVSAAMRASEGRETKAEMIYKYVTGSEFRARIGAIVEAFTAMQADLNSEKNAMHKIWAKREKQIAAVISGTVGMYGDMQGIAGSSVLEIESMGLDALGEG